MSDLQPPGNRRFFCESQTLALRRRVKLLIFNQPYAVLLESYGIRKGSGKVGKYKSGDGTVRRVRFLEEMTVLVVFNLRRVPVQAVGGGHGKA